MKSLSVHLTDKCNNSCNFCVVNSSQKSKEKVNQKVIYNFLKENAGKGYECVNLHGGEPTTIPELLNILEDIRGFDYPAVSIQTNARLLKDLEFAKSLVDRGVDLFVVSLHGKDAAQQDYFTNVEGSFDETVIGIKNVIALGKKVRTNTVVCKQNVANLREIVELAISLGVQHINISAIHPAGKAFKNFHQVTPHYFEIMDEVKKAVDFVVEKNITCTLEGFPYCVLGEYERYMLDWEQNHFKLLYRTTILEDYDKFMRNESCKQVGCCKYCDKLQKCGGVYKEYLLYYGADEFAAIKE
ncbi:radical SAM protein [Clostridium boliviensis]|uniref:Radical SAM protein n=1 Tax=Clostridium boliviensis TaxID=318465 RepID=A0ABU4GQT8_9CLOT|nr:radical SAM protein [Clostridium boliviensis]MDW2799928.1 radical SAM protein [Clostridium boliviensis]